MIKVKPKISACFRSKEGGAHFGRMRGYIAPMKKQGGKVWEALAEVFQGTRFVPRRNER